MMSPLPDDYTSGSRKAFTQAGAGTCWTVVKVLNGIKDFMVREGSSTKELCVGFENLRVGIFSFEQVPQTREL